MKTLSKLKKDLDKWFSLYIRLRYADENGYTECYTCGKIDHYKKMQCGHFLSRRYHTTRWNTTNCQVQCVKCNMYEQGEQYKFGTKLSMEFGVEEVEYLTNLANSTMKRTRGEYKEDISYYQNLVKNLKNTKGID